MSTRFTLLFSSVAPAPPVLQWTNAVIEYGQCGVGAYCLGGCDPASSFSLDACVPAPVCKSATYDFNDLSGMESNTKYLGDASQADWVYSGTPLEYQGNVLLTMAEGSVGTLIASTHYVWYGKVTARMKTSAGQGVVTAFILLADSKDEIDFEFVGIELGTAQTNFYNQGITNYNNGGNTTTSSDVHENYHIYEFDWNPDTITWSVDGSQVRVLNREDTWNETANRYSFPQTPARIQLSLWPAGLSTNGEGTIAWAGGLIDWNSPYMTNGYYYATFDQVTVECYEPPSGANIQGSNSYIFNDETLTNSSVEICNDNTVLKSFLADGLNMNKGQASGTSSANQPAQTVPGSSGIGPGTVPGQGSISNSSTNSASASVSGSASTGFVQGNGGVQGNAASEEIRVPPVFIGSSLAAVIVGVFAFVAL